jgi:hypothetical protein
MTGLVAPWIGPEDLWGALLGLWLALCLALFWVRVRVRRAGRRCPKCLRPWDAEAERGWGHLEHQARVERRRRHP